MLNFLLVNVLKLNIFCVTKMLYFEQKIALSFKFIDYICSLVVGFIYRHRTLQKEKS